ncbi:MAG: (Fe-S)-binding protein [Desulfobulbaceae bacterium]|nr:MAG: (Fe-S)-binding protein [Desulfobulbaceae bacterium]
MTNLAERIKRDCTGCGVCAARCGFLKQYGLPGDIADSLLVGRCQTDPFICSLCNLCAAVCPEKLEPGDFFLDLRRRAVSQQAVNFRPYRVILGYEKRGNSSLFFWDGLPSACRSVFFPGCSLPGTRRQSTLALYRRLRAKIPNLGVMLACCSKLSHDLGRQEHFLREFGKIRTRLLNAGVRDVLVACPNCYKVFRQYGNQLRVRSVWEALSCGRGAKSAPMAAESDMEPTTASPIHLADLLVNPQKALTEASSPAKAPWTYLHRLRLKRQLQRM